MNNTITRAQLEKVLAEETSVVSARTLLLDSSESNCLLLQRSEHHKTNVGLMEHPGGKLEPHEKAMGIKGIVAASLREAEEETGFSAQYERGLWILDRKKNSEGTGERIVVGSIATITGGALIDFDSLVGQDHEAQPEHTAATWHRLGNSALAGNMTVDTINLLYAFNHPTSVPCIPLHRRDVALVLA